MVILKRSYGNGEFKKCIAIVGAHTALTSTGPHTTPIDWGQNNTQNGNLCKFGPTNFHATGFALKKWLYRNEAAGMESSKMYCPSRCKYRTYQCGTTNYPILWGQCRAQNGNAQNFRTTNSNGTAFAPKQWLYQKEAKGMKTSKM